MPKMSLTMAMAKLAYYSKMVQDLQNEEKEQQKLSKIIKSQALNRKITQQTEKLTKILQVRAKQEQAVSKLTKSQQTKFNIRDEATKVYKSKNIGKSTEWKLEHKTYYKQVEVGVKGGVVTSYGTLEADRHQYLMDILNNSKISGMSLEAKSAALEWVPKYNKKGKKHKGDDLDETAYFKRAKSWTKRLARNLEKNFGTKKWDAFTDKIIQYQKLGASRAKELKNIKSKKAFFTFLINQYEYDQLGSSFVTMWNHTSRAFKNSHKYFWTNPSSDPNEIKKREAMMKQNYDDMSDADRHILEFGKLAKEWK